ncbi:uncharacterized protein MONOS_10303 [Monocercomonoides exilis]|uniref:uncharacterized protein n=1 Tax=Monocercomonoides exilis TaxID=2049356 RepID=UPI00355956B3|nr:hypothetical protein MONOS_10303 [Monocercomonoides exilis]|eukprot:MONOS_10303.1-p1 / transcript=MONOS_10303.1 / gene=MONOS_10303 / organism=Monocercomonoides_exilis_PA203 / gene_product=unspecified product / transcript_product=unspecified product / location=Mono_scaffold00462:37680-46679(+) / protein_length=2999 / sequence_SO=supercontig / SO=protein_coding / is_pseudo=false
MVLFLIVLACNYTEYTYANKQLYDRRSDEECESEKIFVHPQVHRCLKNLSGHKVYYNYLLQRGKDSKRGIGVGSTDIEGECEKHDLQPDQKENKRYYRTIESEISSDYWMHLYRKHFNEFPHSEIEGCICAWNSSIELKGIGLIGGERGSMVRGRRGSVVVVRWCVVGIGKDNEAGAFDLSGSIGVLRNITLKGWRNGGEIYSGRLFGGKGYGGEKGGSEEKGGGGGGGGGEGVEGSISVSESHFSSFCVSSAPFLSSPTMPFVSLSHLTFFNISTGNDACSSPTTTSTQTTCFMSSCSFSSVCDVFDGGIVHSLNNPLASLTASNASFIGCCRTRNVECNGTSDNKKQPRRQNITDNGPNTFTWCEWSESRTTGTSDSVTDGISSGGAICMYNLNSGELSISNCLFNNCFAYSRGGGIMCNTINSVYIENDVFNACIAQNHYGGGLYVVTISTCVRISRCEFQKCSANGWGGGLRLEDFQVSGSGCIPTESGEGVSACVFDCSFSSCSLSGICGGGMYCVSIPATQFKMRSIQFISCSALREGGGLCLHPRRDTTPDNKLYCFFLFFHECSCRDAANPYGNDVEYVDAYNLYLDSGNPFHECYTTNTDDKRVCLAYYPSGTWTYDQTLKKDWLKRGVLNRFVAESSGYEEEFCGANESYACRTIGVAVIRSVIQVSLTVTLLEGDHISETATIDIGTKKISVIGKGKDKSSIEMKSLSSTCSLFSVTSGHLGMSHLKADCCSNASPSPSVVVVSDGSGSLSLEDVVITTSVSSGNYVMSSSVFVVPLSQLSMVDVEIINMNVSEPLFSEPNLSSPSSSSLLSLSSSALCLTATASGDRVLANVKVMNVKLTEGDGVVVAKSVKAGETFVVKNMTIEDCECENGSGGGIKVELESSSSKLQMETTTINRCKCSGYGGGMMLHLVDGSHDFSIKSVGFSGCTANSGGNYLFVNGSNSARWGITTEKLNVQHDNSKYNELVGYDRSDTTMGLFPLNVFLDSYPDAAHVGKAKDGLGGYDSQFCGFAYYPCATITHAAQLRYAGKNKSIELDPGFELAEEVSMADTNEWKIFCAAIETKVNVIDPETKSSDWLIKTQNTCSCTIDNITFSIPTVLTDVTSLIFASSALLKLTDCSVGYSSGVDTTYQIEYSFVKATEGNLRLVRFMIKESLIFDGHSFVEFEADMNVVYFEGCSISSVEKKNGDGGLINGAIGKAHASAQDTSGIVVIDSCTIKNCKCHGKENDIGRGGGIFVRMDGKGSVVVNGSNKIGGCEAKNYEGGTKGRGGGMMVEILNSLCTLNISSENAFSPQVLSPNDALYGKDAFIRCGSKIWLNEMVNENSFSFFDKTTTPSDVLKFCGSEDLKDGEVIPLFVYLRSIGSTLTVGRSRDMVLDHSYCGFEKFGCLTIDYCMNTRVDDGLQTVEVVSKSSITNVIKVISRSVNLKGKEESVGEKMKVEVKDGGDTSPNYLIECTKSFEMTNLEFVMNKEINGKRYAFIYSSSSTVTIISCSVSFTSDALTIEKIGYNILNIEGGILIVEGFAMEGPVKMNKKSPITITNGERLEMKNSRVSGVTVEGGSGKGGCICAAIKDGGSTVLDNCSFSSTCTGGGGMKGGGIMISAEDGGSLEIKSATFTGCQVPTEDNLQKGRGKGGGMFVELADTMGSFQMEGVTFSECNAWKGKKVFISGNDLSEVMPNEKLKEELSTSDKKSLDELCGWERASTGEEGYVIPLVVYLWTNWSGNGFVSKEKGGDFSGCGFSEAPCSSIDHLISLRFEPLGEGESHINIVGTGLLSHSISFSFISSSILELPKVVIKATAKGTGVTVTDEDENDPNDSMISSNVNLSLVNMSFTKPVAKTNHAVFIESSGTNTVLTVTDCSFGSLTGVTETAGYCMMRVNGGSVMIERCSLSLISELKGFITFSPSVNQVIVQKVNISLTTVTEGSLITMIEEENQMNEKENSHSNGNRPVLRVVECSFANITNEGIGAGVIEVGSFEHGVEYIIDECSITNCKSALGTEGGGMRVVLKSEETVFKINDSSFSICKCSKESGFGGGLFINGAEDNVNYADETQIPPLKFKIVNILFYMNEAFVGENIFIRCFSIEHQINETLFDLNYSQESLNSNNSICGRDVESEGDVDLIPLITYYYGLQVFLNGTGSDGRQCGAQTNPCSSINCGVDHIEQGVMNAILIDGEGTVTKECVIGDLVVSSFKKTQSIVKLNSKIEKSFEKDCIMEFINESAVERCSFEFEDTFKATHSYLIEVKNGSMEIHKCEFFSSADEVKLNSSIVSVESGELKISETSFRDMYSITAVLSFCEESDVTIDEIRILNIRCEGNVVSVGGKAKVEMKEMVVENVTLLSNGCVIGVDDAEQEVSVLNCSFGKCVNSVNKGSMMQIRRSKDVRIEACVFDGEKKVEIMNEEYERKEGLCKWNGSLIDFETSNVEMKETTVMKSKNGGLWVSGGSVKIEKGEFENNNPSIEGYPSARRNVICEGNGELNVVSVKGGDGMLPNTSLWILDEACKLGGIASERGSSYFIPVLEEVKNSTQPNGEMELVILGKLLLPCGLTLRLNMKEGDFELPYTSTIEEGGYISENEVHSMISSELLKVMENKTEVSVCIVFGKNKVTTFNGIVVMNKSESESKRDDNIDEGGFNVNKGGTNNEWSLIVIVLIAVMLLMFIMVFAVFAVVQRKKLGEMLQKIEEMGYKGAIINKAERRKEKSGETFEMSSMPSSLLEGMTSQIPLLIDDEEEISELPTTNDDDDSLNENDLLAFGFPSPALGDVSVSGVEQSHSLKVISAKKPFRENEKKNIKTLHSVIHSVQGNFTLGTRAINVVDGKEVVLAVAELFGHLISVGDERVEMMARQLCPFSIFVEERNENEIYVLTEELEDEKLKNEMKRWQAPEVGNENGSDREEEEEEGIEQGVVYVLGLILHEMITGEVPLSECKAEEAQEMMRDGVRPLTEGIEGEELVEMMERMWKDDPNDRPTLKEVKKSIKKIMNDQVE